MEKNKNILLGVGALVVIVAIILIVTLTGKKDRDMVVPVTETPTEQTATPAAPARRPSSSAPAASTFAFTAPKAGSTLTRGSVYTVTWTGEAKCYDLGYVLNPKQDTPYNFIAKVCENNAGVFNYKWTVPPNVQPGNYGLELKNSGATGPGITTTTFILK